MTDDNTTELTEYSDDDHDQTIDEAIAEINERIESAGNQLERELAVAHFERTGVILPNFEDAIAEYLATNNGGGRR